MKILQVNITGKSGSTGKIVNDLRTYLQSKGHDAKVAYSVDNIAAKSLVAYVVDPFDFFIIQTPKF